MRPGKLLLPGTVLRIRGERGVFKFVGTAKDGSLTVYGGPTGHEMYRNFTSDRAKVLRKQPEERA